MAETKIASKCPFCGEERGQGPPICAECGFDEDVAKEDYGSVSEAVNRIKERHRRSSLWKIAVPVPQPATVPGEPQDPVLQGPNPEGANMHDNAQNSPEQEVAMQHWVNSAVAEINRGVDPLAVVAKLTHDGCPDPEQVVAIALAQPFQEEQPVEETLTEAPPSPQPEAQADISDSQPPMQLAAKVRVAGFEGVELDRYSDLWGRGIVRVALDNGQVVEVQPEEVEQFEAEHRNPVSEIQEFIDSFPPVAANDLPSIQANIANWREVKTACRQLLAADPLSSGVSLEDQIRLAEIENDADDALSGAKTAAAMYLSPEDQAYLSRESSINRLHKLLPQGEKTAYAGTPVEEAAAIWAVDNPWDRNDVEGFQLAALSHARSVNMDEEQRKEFLRYAHTYATNIEEETPEEQPEYDDGPAEQLFL